MQAVIENFRAHIFALHVLPGLKCSNFYITEWLEKYSSQKNTINKPYIEKAEAEVFPIVSVRKMSIAENKRLSEIAGYYFSASRKSRNLVKKGQDPQKSRKNENQGGKNQKLSYRQEILKGQVRKQHEKPDFQLYILTTSGHTYDCSLPVTIFHTCGWDSS